MKNSSLNIFRVDAVKLRKRFSVLFMPGVAE
jgi:hypothetical protein